MKAIVITQYGAPDVLKIEERAVPDLQADEVLIQVKAAGINRPDIFQRKGNYPPPPNAPQDIPGLEVAGTIAAIGDQVVQWHVGDRVCALVAGGGYAEYVAVSAGQCLPIPSSISLEEAASLPETVYTVWHNVFQRGALKAKEHFLVHGGSSGIGITAIQLAKAFGAEVYTTAGTEEKCLACLKFGAKEAINYHQVDFASYLQKEGMDVILDMVGGPYFEKNIQLIKPEGRLVYINAISGNQVNLNIAQLMQKRITITGSTLRSRDTHFKAMLTEEIKKQVWPLLLSGAFKPLLYKSFPLAEAAEAHRLMESSEHIGKIVLSI